MLEIYDSIKVTGVVSVTPAPVPGDMTRPTYTKPDKNQAQIVEELRKLGFDVDIVCDLPGLYDLVVSGWKLGCVSLRVEVKDGKKMLTPSELHYYNKQKYPDSYIVARCTEDVLEWFNG